jgi:hypothetical protein
MFGLPSGRLFVQFAADSFVKGRTGRLEAP